MVIQKMVTHKGERVALEYVLTNSPNEYCMQDPQLMNTLKNYIKDPDLVEMLRLWLSLGIRYMRWKVCR